uniref:Uncharacterized protein n=1 Tax=Timema cristinae TaxID=61476 RepID=A0A7R9CC15_TIMCR|nr:unnamed protein product [Timema cristinae]
MDAEEAAGPSHSDAYEAFQTAMNWLERQPERTATQLVPLKRLRDMAAKRRVFCFATPQATLRTFVHESRLTTDIICACAYPHSWTVQMGTQPPTSLVFLSCWMRATRKDFVVASSCSDKARMRIPYFVFDKKLMVVSGFHINFKSIDSCLSKVTAADHMTCRGQCLINVGGDVVHLTESYKMEPSEVSVPVESFGAQRLNITDIQACVENKLHKS